MGKPIRISQAQRAALEKFAKMSGWGERPHGVGVGTLDILEGNGLIRSREATVVPRRGQTWCITDLGRQVVNGDGDLADPKISDNAEIVSPLELARKRLRSVRVHKGLSQQEVASKAMISRNSLTMIEQGDQGMNLGQLSRLAQVLNVPLYLFFAPDDLWKEFAKELV